jgi:RNA polymerase sigma factor (sigma-70 family)
VAHSLDTDHLLAEATWLQRLAARLADDGDDADDLVQDAWIAAWQRRPDAGRSLRPWLAKVVRDAARMRRRAAHRRRAREDRAAAGAEDAAADPEALLAQAEMYRTLVELVLALDEPYRATVLGRFFAGRTAAELARDAGIPEATVRGRLRVALARLRDQLDARARRRAWMPILWMSGKTKTAAAIAAAALIALLITWLVGGARGGAGGPGGARGGPIGAAASGEAGRRDGGGAGASAATVVPSWLAPADASTRAIAGVVVSDTGAPIAGATVQLQGWSALDAAGTPGDEARAVTGADGRFRFAPRYGRLYSVTATATDTAPASAFVDPRAPYGRGDPSALVLVLGACTQSATGSVTDAGGGAIPGAVIQRLTPNLVGPFGATTTTGADGGYRICLPRGTSWLDVGADGYEHVLREVVASGHHRVDVALAPGAVIGGQVVELETGAPIARASVDLAPMVRRSGEAGDRHAMTGADGRFSVDGVAAGRYLVSVRDATHVRGVIDELVVGGPGGVPPLVIRLARGVEVRGVVRANTEPVAGALVALELGAPSWGGSDPTPLDAVTDAAGRFVFRGVPARAVLTPRVTGYAVVGAAAITTAGAAVDDAVIDVVARPALRGRVVRDGAPVAGATVTASTASVRLPPQQADGVGGFELVGLTPGRYTLFASSEAAGAFTTAAAQPVIEVPARDEVVIELDGGGVITGRVVDAAGAPLIGAEVKAIDLPRTDLGTAITAIDGGFSIAALAGGRYTFEVRSAIGAPAPLAWAGVTPAPVDLGGGHGRVGPIELRVETHASSIAGRVIDDMEAPVADAIVRLGPIHGWTTAVPITRTDRDGAFRVATLGDGPFSLDAGIGGGPLAAVDDVAPGATGVVLRLIRPAALEGTVDGIAGARVWLQRTGGVDGAASVPDRRRTARADGGRFAFDALAPGHYTVLAVGGAATASAEVTLAPGARAAVRLAAADTRRITGRLVVIGSGAPVADTWCAAVPATGDVRPAGIDVAIPARATTDASGHFAIEHAPSGEALVICGARPGVSSGAARIAVGARDATIEVAPVPDGVPGSFGFTLDTTRILAAVDVVDPGAGAAGLQRGDRVVEVGGRDVSRIYVDAVHWLIAAGGPGGIDVGFERSGTRFTRTIRIASTPSQ